MTLSFEQARECVLREVQPLGVAEQVPVPDCAGRVLAEPVVSDRDYPPFPRSARDGYAVRAVDVPGSLRVIGEVRAGEVFGGTIGGGEAVEIMTGAPLPEGADAVIMVEHTERVEDHVQIRRSLNPGDNFNRRGAEARKDDVLLQRGRPPGIR